MERERESKLITRLAASEHAALKAEADSVNFSLNDYVLAVLSQRDAPAEVARREYKRRMKDLEPHVNN